MRTLVAFALVGIGCGPQVPFDQDDETGGDGTDASDVGGDIGGENEVGGDIGGDPSAPNPSDPSAPTSDPDSDTGATDPTTATSGPIEGCGDGVLDPGEECDDGDVDDGDACSSACTIAVELLWSVSIDGAGSFDVANDVVLAADGTAYVVGSTRLGSTDVLVQQIFADGTLGFTWLWDGAESMTDEAFAVAWTPAGDLAIVGSTESMATGDDVLVLVFDPDSQTAAWSRVFDGPGSGAGQYDDLDLANDVAVDPGGNVVVAATVRVGEGNYDVWVAELTAGGEDVWSQTYAGPDGERDDANAVIIDAMGGVAVVAGRNDGVESFTWFLDGVGGVVGELGPHAFVVNDAAVGSDGAIAMAGVFEEDGFGDDEVMTSLLDAGWATAWSVEFDGSDAVANAVTRGPSSEVVTVGTRGASGEQDNAWVVAYYGDGSPWWGDAYNGDADLEDAFNAAAIANDGSVIAVGSETVIGQQTNVLVRRYLPH
jgi:cysteine-rich repeat protein